MTGLIIIFAVLAVLAIGALAMHFLLHKGAQASKGGVQPPDPEAGTRHNPPFESVEHRS
jgi:hypothetical protein